VHKGSTAGRRRGGCFGSSLETEGRSKKGGKGFDTQGTTLRCQLRKRGNIHSSAKGKKNNAVSKR